METAVFPPPAPPPSTVPVPSAPSPSLSVAAAGSGSRDGVDPRPGDGRPRADWTVEALQGWHLPLLDDPAFVPLHPLLQRSLLLAVPERLMTALAARRPLVPHVLVAWGRDGRGRPQALGLLVSRRLNRSGSCWQVEHLCHALRCAEDPLAPPRRLISAALLREAILRGRGAASWIARAAAVDDERLACLREQGFQPQRTDQLWRWSASAAPERRSASSPLPGELQLLPLNRRSAPLLWHLEQACCPAQLRQLLDRRIEDLLDQSQGRGWLLVDPVRSEAVAGARWLADHPAGGHCVEFSLHPAWSHLLGPATEVLLRRLAPGDAPLWLHSEVGDGERHAWLAGLGAEPRGEEVLMARSVWRRQEWQPAPTAARRRLAAVLEQLQPRRQPVPSPLAPLPPHPPRGCPVP